jgi:hypothetical protein
MSNDLHKDESYYDLNTNLTFVRGYESQSIEEVKRINDHPYIFSSIYSISKTGQVYCIMDDQYLKWDFVDKYPSVNLLCKKEAGDLTFTKKRFYIKDLMACSYIANANDYLERGYKVVNIDGNPKNCEYHNIIFIDPNKDY